MRKAGAKRAEDQWVMDTLYSWKLSKRVKESLWEYGKRRIFRKWELQHSSIRHSTPCSDLLGHLSVTGSEQHPQCCLSVSNYDTVFVTQRSKTNRSKVPPNRQHFLQSTKMCKGMTGPSSRAESVNALAHRSDSICRNPQEQPKNLIKKKKKSSLLLQILLNRTFLC